MKPRSIPWQLRALGMIFIVGLALWAAITVARAEGGWRMTQATSYGPASQYGQGFYWGEGGSYTSWGWHCSPLVDGSIPVNPVSTVQRGTSLGVAHRTLPLGSWIELLMPRPDGTTVRLVVPVTDRGPYAAGFDLDVQEPLVQAVGWRGAVAPPGTSGVAWGEYWGHPWVSYRPLPEWGVYCPRRGQLDGVVPAMLLLDWAASFD